MSKISPTEPSISERQKSSDSVKQMYKGQRMKDKKNIQEGKQLVMKWEENGIKLYIYKKSSSSCTEQNPSDRCKRPREDLTHASSRLNPEPFNVCSVK